MRPFIHENGTRSREMFVSHMHRRDLIQAGAVALGNFVADGLGREVEAETRRGIFDAHLHIPSDNGENFRVEPGHAKHAGVRRVPGPLRRDLLVLEQQGPDAGGLPRSVFLSEVGSLGLQLREDALMIAPAFFCLTRVLNGSCGIVTVSSIRIRQPPGCVVSY